MKKIIKIAKDYTFGFILGILLFGIVGVYAVTTLQSSKVTVDTTNMPNVGSNKTVQDTIEYLYNKPYCPDGYECYFSPQVGDYVKMTPTLTSFTTDKTYTGDSGAQTINPSELNLWRVIRINDDGTIDMVSQYVSSTSVYFKAQTGYKNIVGYLNVLASKYENSKYTVGSRHMGYNGQTEYLTDTANTVDSTSTTAPWASSTGSSTVESQGGGDTLYTTDTNLVTNAIGTLVANEVGTQSSAAYWLASRYYNYSNSTYWSYIIRYTLASGSVYNDFNVYRYENGFRAGVGSLSLRPIVTLKSDITSVSGSGTSTNPWVLS